MFRALIKLGQNVSETNRRPTNPLRAAVLGIMSVALGLICANWEQPSLASELAWQALQEGGAVALLRHAHAPEQVIHPSFGSVTVQLSAICRAKDGSRPAG